MVRHSRFATKSVDRRQERLQEGHAAASRVLQGRHEVAAGRVSARLLDRGDDHALVSTENLIDSAARVLSLFYEPNGPLECNGGFFGSLRRQ